MGAYLNKPVLEKISVDDSNDNLSYGASCMQGWRVSQEDAHNAILDYDKDTAFFAVYDGHGGHEVAVYSSQKLPDFVKALSEYKSDSISVALVKGIMEFDSTLTKPEIKETLKEMADIKSGDEDSESDIEELCKEASMPVEEVVEKYKSNCLNEKILSPALKAKKDRGQNESSACTDEESSSSNDCSATKETTNEEKLEKMLFSSDSELTEESNHVNNNEDCDNVNTNIKDSVDIVVNGGNSEKECKITEKTETNGVLNDENDDSYKGKGKSLVIKSQVQNFKKIEQKREAAIKAREIYRQIKEGADADDDDTESEDESFDGCKGNLLYRDSESEECSEEENEVDLDEEELEGEEEEYSDDDNDEIDANLQAQMAMNEEPGFDSGCTACVALIKKDKLYVANVGDSRCVVSCDGKALEMSIDHKPEDPEEQQRIEGAGGKVTADGRVNGGLNLSRAIGDHGYKLNDSLSADKQMICALPDVKVHTICEKDRFMIVACDGIWNSLTSQEVCDFVQEKLDSGETKLSKICESVSPFT